MLITNEWIESIQDKDGLTGGQVKLLEIWRKKQNFACFEVLPDRVARFIEACKGYRGEWIRDRRSFAEQNGHKSFD